MAAADSDLGFFPSGYESSRDRFRSTIEELRGTEPGLESGKIPVPSRIDGDLTVDYVMLPAHHETQDLLILTSGVHGPEGYAGSAIQQLFLKEIFPRINHDRVGVLMIHAVNPFGFKYHRRVTENNVNLNRNFGVSEDLFSTRNEGYAKLADLLAPKGPVRFPGAEDLLSSFRLTGGLVLGQFSMKEMTDAIGEGQYRFPEGIEFGGRSFEPQVPLVLSLMFKAMAPYRRVVFLDLHTGLGSGYQLHMMTDDRLNDAAKGLLKRILRPEADGDLYDLATGDDPGFYPTTGDFTSVLPGVQSKDQQVVSLTAEFGTIGDGIYPKLQTVNRLILENQGYHHGYRNPRIRQKVEDDFLELFFPSDPAWREAVLAKARGVLNAILSRL